MFWWHKIDYSPHNYWILEAPPKMCQSMKIVLYFNNNKLLLFSITCLRHRPSQGLVGGTEQAESARAEDKRETREGDDGNERTGASREWKSDRERLGTR